MPDLTSTGARRRGPHWPKAGQWDYQKNMAAVDENSLVIFKPLWWAE